MIPPKPRARRRDVSLWTYARLFRRDILSAQPDRLYRAKMAEFRTPFFRSYMINDPALIDRVLRREADDFPKSERLREGLAPLLGNSVFVTNGETWKRQRRIIDPAFEGGRLRQVFPAIWDAGRAAVARLEAQAAAGPVEIEAITSHAAADVIFRTLFSIPIEHETAAAVFAEFRAYQRAAPILNLAALLALPRWLPRPVPRRARRAARTIRGLIAGLCQERLAQIAQGTAPDDLASKIMTTADPQTGETFSTGEMIDQVAIFFLAGHETSASALGWALYLLARDPGWQDRVAQEALAEIDPEKPYFSTVSRLKCARDVFREALRLYPPVPMMVRQNTCPKTFRDREIAPGAQVVISPWHLHRHENRWDNPDGFDPGRFASANGKACLRDAFIPFSTGPRACPGAGFAMIEGPLILAMILRNFRLRPKPGHTPVPVAQLTVRAQDGIWLQFDPRST